MVAARINIPQDRIEAFCRKWKVRELALFGSVLRDDFRPQSDVDVLVTFAQGSGWDLWNFIEMKEELETVFGRPVVLVEKGTIENPFRRHAIMNNYQVIHE